MSANHKEIMRLNQEALKHGMSYGKYISAIERDRLMASQRKTKQEEETDTPEEEG